MEEIMYQINLLDVSVKELRKSGTSLAQAEKEYKIKLRQEALKLKTEGMAVTLINSIVYGDKEVAELRFKRDVAEAVYKANLESINALKLKLRIMENQYERDWGQAKRS